MSVVNRKTKEKNPVLAICYDFDKTLSPTDMQAQGYIQSVGYDVNEFWEKTDALAMANDMDSNLAYMNDFMAYVANGKVGETRPNATTQTYVLAHYDGDVAELVEGEFKEWRELMESLLRKIYGGDIGGSEAEAMMILIAGTFICNYNNALTGNINDNIIGYLSNLSKS